MARILKLDAQRPDERALELAASTLARGGVVVYPTDTIYGLGADATNPDAVRRVFEIKGRDASAPLPALVNEVRMVEEFADELPRLAKFLAGRFWNGALTIIVRARRLRHLGSDKVGFRAPAHEVPLRIIELLGAPIVGTSANISGRGGASEPREIERQLGDAVDLIIDCGPAKRAVPSTVIDVTQQPPVIVREGAIPREALERALGMKVETKGEG